MTVLNSMGRYATHTEIALWTTRAYEAAGQLDSAQVYAAVVRRAWRNADPSVRRQLAWLVPESQSNARVAVAVPPMGAKLDEAAARSFNDLRRRK